jgi:hypothetical protein
MRSVLKDAYEALDYLKNTDIQLEGNVSKSEIGSKNSKDVNLKIDSKGILYFLDLLVSFQIFKKKRKTKWTKFNLNLTSNSKKFWYFFEIFFIFKKNSTKLFAVAIEERNLQITFSSHQLYIKFMEILQKYGLEETAPDYSSFHTKLTTLSKKKHYF